MHVVGASEPLGSQAVALRLYTYATDAVGQMMGMVEDGVTAVGSGFDGLLISEHHGKWPGYLPNPLQAAGALLGAVPDGCWVAPCPILPLIRPPSLLVEDLAWMAATYPGRLGVGVAAGFADADLTLGNRPIARDRLAFEFEGALRFLSTCLTGDADGVLGEDLAVARLRQSPVPLISAAMSATACCRAARVGVGIMLDSTCSPQRIQALTADYRRAGGAGVVWVTRRVWIGAPPEALVAEQDARERSIATGAAGRYRSGEHLMTGGDPEELAERLEEFIRFTAVDSVALRVHLEHSIDPTLVRRQIEAIGQGSLPLVRKALAAPPPPASPGGSRC